MKTVKPKPKSQLYRLTSIEPKHKDAEFIEEIIEILRNEGYAPRHWLKLREKAHWWLYGESGEVREPGKEGKR